MVCVADFELVTPTWKHHRVIHSKYPTQNLYDRDDEMNLILGYLSSDTSARVQYPTAYVDVDDVRFGDGWGAVMASFCYPSAGRFSTHTDAAYYAGDSEHTAIAEWSYHTAKVWRGLGYTDDVSAVVRCYVGHVELPLVDVRGHADLHHPDNYAVSQALAGLVRAEKLGGILYDSVRHAGSENIALLRPPATTKVTQAGHYTLRYTGSEFTTYAKCGEFRTI